MVPGKLEKISAAKDNNYPGTLNYTGSTWFFMFEEEYQLEYFKNQGFTRKICKSCGSAFWTRDSSRDNCGDAACEPYTFIGNPVFVSTKFACSAMRQSNGFKIPESQLD